MRGKPLERVGVGIVVALLALPVAGLVLAAVRPPGGASALAGEAGGFGDWMLRADLWRIALDTLWVSLASTGLALVVGVAFAWLERRAEYPGRRVWAWLTLVPLTIPSYLVAGALRESLGPGGAVGAAFGLPAFKGLGAAILVLALVNAPFVQVLVSSAWVRASRREEEAARSLGASPGAVFRTVTWPAVRPAAALGATLALIYIVSDFGAVAVLDAPVLTWRLFQAYETQQLARAAALGLVALALLAPWFWLAIRLQGRDGADRPQVSNPEPPVRKRLSPAGAGAAILGQAAWVSLGVVVPLTTLAGWMLDARRTGETFAPLGRVTATSLVYAAGGAAVVVAVTAFLARVATRSGGRTARRLDVGVFLAGALPAVLIGFGLLAALLAGPALGGRGYAWLRQAGLLLALGYLVKFASQGYSGTRAAMRRLDPRQEETARSLGLTNAAVWRRVRLPLLAPGIAASAFLVFLMLLKELPLTLMLQPIGGRTLSYRIFDRYQEAFFHDAAAAGFALVLLAWAVQALTSRWRAAGEGLG